MPLRDRGSRTDQTDNSTSPRPSWNHSLNTLLKFLVDLEEWLSTLPAYKDLIERGFVVQKGTVSCASVAHCYLLYTNDIVNLGTFAKPFGVTNLRTLTHTERVQLGLAPPPPPTAPPTTGAPATPLAPPPTPTSVT